MKNINLLSLKIIINPNNLNIKTNILIYGILLILFTTSSYNLNAQDGNQQYQFKNHHYKKMNNKWYVGSDSADYYKVEKGKIVVKYIDSISLNNLNQIQIDYSLGSPFKNLFGWKYYNIAAVGDSIFQIAEALLNDNNVFDVVIPTYGKFNLMPNDTKNDESQWYLSSNQILGLPTINIESAWNLTTGSPNIVIAVIDGGMDWDHPDFGLGIDNYDNIYRNSGENPWSTTGTPIDGDGIDDDLNGYVDDWMGWDFESDDPNYPSIEQDNDTRPYSTDFEHGLNVSSIIGAKTNNSFDNGGNVTEGIAGIAGGWKNSDGTFNEGCKILLCKMGEWDNSTNSFIFSTDDLVEAINYSIDMGVDVINLSLSTAQNEPTVESAIDAAFNEGITVICSSGNQELNHLRFPASLPKVISVGAIDVNEEKLDNTNYGDELDLSAPGEFIVALTTASYAGNDGVNTPSGTSFSTPIVSGVVGLMKSVNPCLGPELIRDILANTSDRIGPYNYSPIYSDNPYHCENLGHGRVNAYNAVFKAQSTYSSVLDLYIKDRFDDLGDEVSNYPVYNAPEIWVRNNQDGIESHQNPSSTSGVDYVYMRIRNKSCVASSNGMSVSLYYTLASTTSVWPNDYNLIGQQTISEIAAGESKIFNIEWNHIGMPSGENVCLIAVIDGSSDPKTSYNPSLGLGHWITNDNNIAQKNLTITATSISNIWNGLDVPCGGTAYISNIYNEEFLYNIDFGYDEENRSLIFRQAEVNIFVNEDFWNIVNNSPDIEFNGVEVINENNLRLLNSEASINNLNMNPSEKFQVYIGYNFYSRYAEDTDELFYYSINQKESGEDGRYLGSMHFRILKESRDDFEADAGGDLIVESSTFNSVSAQDINETAVYNWYNNSDSLINNGKSFSYSSNKNSKLVLEVIADNDNFKDYDTINIKVKKHKILSINPNPSSSIIDIHYKTKNSTLSQIVIQRVDNSNLTYIYNINSGLNHKQINVSNYPIGVYNVFLVCDGDFSLAKKLIIQ